MYRNLYLNANLIKRTTEKAILFEILNDEHNGNFSFWCPKALTKRGCINGIQYVALDIPDEFIMIPMDAVLIEQVITNLLENAVLHAEGMTKILFKVYKEKGHIVFQVIDDGCGISKDRLNKIFTGYYEKKEVPADSKKRNMGIGLSVCASIIKAHGGTITAENLPVKGCRFRFTLKMEESTDE